MIEKAACGCACVGLEMTGELSPISGYGMWNIDAGVCVCLSFLKHLKLQKNYKTITSNFCKPFPKIHQLFTFCGII